MRAAVSFAGLVMACSFVGYGAFLHSISFGLLPGLFATLVIWALPGQVVFADLWMNQAGLLATALAVTLTAVRLLPMTMLVLSRARLQGVRRWPEFLVAHFTAITMWVIATTRMEKMSQRAPHSLAAGSRQRARFDHDGDDGGRLLPGRGAAAEPCCDARLFHAGFLLDLAVRQRPLAIRLLGDRARRGAVAARGMFAPRFDLLIAGMVGGHVAFHRLARPRRPEEGERGRTGGGFRSIWRS